MDETRIMTIGEVCATISDTYRAKADEVTLINTSDVLEGKVLNHERVPNKELKGQFKKTFKKNDILYSEIRPQNKRFAFVDFDPVDYIASTKLMVLRADSSKVLPMYLYFYLKSAPVVAELQMLAETRSGTFPQITFTELSNLTIPVPSITEQQAIVTTIKCIEDKIDCNTEINDNLYDLLQSVYQLQFGVTSGNAAEGTLSDICSYTKDRIAVSELNLGNYYSTENMLPGKAGFTEATSLPTTSQTTRCNAGDVLVSNIRPYFKKIVLCHSEGGCSTDVLCFAPKAPAYSAYLFCTLYADRFFDFMVAGSKGTKMPRGDKQQIMTFPVYIPTESELTAFADFATPILSQIHGNNEENARLEHLRDTLLPKLMSGEIDVSAIDI